ncbi:MAG: ATP-binding cassette domain-containing protein [Thiohalophilus sp.]|uniref:ATP-binding cassette domain-containing protein n=1 Tax=Thiohalophilus sp. TaxID=3028392 RepID=UPI00286FBBD4|nr:ATP-binding cassette domain-containing protein [Thiohalophilus sp.]MDR9435535.1 ATP-binding cassette domain-containing protein [Thiohalophilus sp.]
MQPIVRARHLQKHFPGFTAVKDVSFDIPRGQCFGFLGPNGAGKTTTLRMLLGLSPSTGGELTLFDLDIRSHARDIRRRIGVVPQQDNLDPDFTVRENLQIYASYFAIPASEVKSRITSLLEFAALSDRADAKTNHLSGGMQRRLTIARALINDPELVILDEPTTGLDPQARHVIWAKLNELRERGKTLILTSHYMEEAERLCDELVIMDHGEILDQGTPAELIRRHVEPEVIEIRGMLSDSREIEQLCRVEHIGRSHYCYTHNPRPLLDHLQHQHELVFLHRPAGLEDVFLNLTGRALRDI